ncbi:hypothetical protein D3C80_2101250 [compost metagenome]
MIVQERAVAFVGLRNDIFPFARFCVCAYINDFPADDIGRVRVASLHHQSNHG